MPKIATGSLGKITRALGAGDQHRAAAVGLQRAIEQAERIDDVSRCLVIGDGHRLAHGRVLVQARVLAGRHRDMRQVFAGGAELVHVALRGEGVIGDSGKMSPRFFPMLVAVADRMARRRIGVPRLRACTHITVLAIPASMAITAFWTMAMGVAPPRARSVA